jgi:hypothetical protein
LASRQSPEHGRRERQDGLCELGPSNFSNHRDNRICGRKIAGIFIGYGSQNGLQFAEFLSIRVP